MLTRLAPTPSGYLHLGNVFSFVLTAAIAEKAGAKLLLRIDDLDRGRADARYVQDIFDTLSFLNIPYDTGPRSLEEFENEWSQVKRLQLYHDAIKELIERDMVFACTCSRTDLARQSTDGGYPGTCLHKSLPLDTPGAALRLITANDATVDVRQWNGRVAAGQLPAAMHNFVVRKKDGFPAYQLSSLVDDRYFAVDLIVRGEDLWASTIAQHYLAKILGYTSINETQFYHHPLLKNRNGEKLSKSAGATSVSYLRQMGKTREDVFTIMAGMFGSDKKLSDRKRLSELFITKLNLHRP